MAGHRRQEWRDHIAHSVFITTEALTPGCGPSCFSPWKDVVVPGHPDYYRFRRMREVNLPSEQRDLLFNFHGRHPGFGPSYYKETEQQSEQLIAVDRRAWGLGGYGKVEFWTSSEQAGYRFGSPEPSLEVLQQRLQESEVQEERLRTQLKDLEHQLAETCGADGEDYSHRKQRFKNHVDEVASTVRQLRQQRAQILEGTDPELQEEQRKRQEIRRFKTSSGYSTEAEIDERIHFLEQQMYDVSMQLLQEKRVLAEIQSLQRQREEESYARPDWEPVVRVPVEPVVRRRSWMGEGLDKEGAPIHYCVFIME
eukprot:g23626.t1